MAESTRSTSNHAEDHEHGLAHVMPLQTLFVVFAVLCLLTYLTVAATWVNLGEFNLWLAMGIATLKASLVALYFMHLRYDQPFNGLVFVISLLFLALFLAITLLDTGQYQPDIQNW
jgi:cytochrome c oxidase subunit 4